MIKKRSYTLSSKDGMGLSMYKIPSVGLIRGWTFKPSELKCPPILKLGHVLLDGKRIHSSDSYHFDVKEIRSYLESVLPDETMSDTEYNHLVTLHSYLFGKQIEAISFFPHVPNDLFFETVFTNEFPIYVLLLPSTDNQQGSFSVEEEYVERVSPSSIPSSSST